jgi:hypothetical protein
MGGDPIWTTTNFADSQKLPDGYEVGREWGEGRNGKVGYGGWYFCHRKTHEFGPWRDDRWAARRDAIEHANKQQ